MVRLRAEAEVIEIQNIEFQFQYGAIKRKTKIRKDKKRKYFNSSMVRLRALRSARLRSARLISIPVWCD